MRRLTHQVVDELDGKVFLLGHVEADVGVDVQVGQVVMTACTKQKQHHNTFI